MDSLNRIILLILLLLLIVLKIYININKQQDNNNSHGERANQHASPSEETKGGGIKVITIYPSTPYVKNEYTRRIRTKNIKEQYREWVINAQNVTEIMRQIQ